MVACLVPGAASGSSVSGVPVRDEVTALGDLLRLPSVRGFVAIGDNAARVRVSASLRQRGLLLATAISPNAYVAPDVAVGTGVLIVHGAVVNAGTRIGDDAIVNTGATVDHDGLIGNGAHIAPGCHLAGNVTVGRLSFLGVGTVVIPGIEIGSESTLGAGSVVIRDLGDNRMAWGNPAHHHEREAGQHGRH